MKYAEFRDKFFDFLFKTLPADQRHQAMPDGAVKKFMQQLSYKVDRISMLLMIWVFLPVMTVIGLVVMFGGVK